MLAENMTWEQINEEFKHKYVGLTNINRNTQKEIVNADVVCSTLETPYEKMLELALEGKLYMICPSADEENGSGVCV